MVDNFSPLFSGKKFSFSEKRLREFYLVFFATENVICSVNRQKKAFLYFLTKHDVEHESITKFAEFVMASEMKNINIIKTKLQRV